MAIRYYPGPSGDYIHIVATGPIHTSEAHGLIDRLAQEPAIGHGCRVLLDATDATIDPAALALWGLADRATPRLLRRIARIGIAASQEFIYGLAREFGALAGVRGLVVAVFRDVDGASRWLASD